MRQRRQPDGSVRGARLGRPGQPDRYWTEPHAARCGLRGVEAVRGVDFKNDDAEEILETYGAAATAATALAVHIADLADNLPARLGTTFANAGAVAAEFAKRLIDYLLVEQIKDVSVPVYEALRVLGIVELKSPGDPGENYPNRSDRVRRAVHFDRVPKLLIDPAGLFSDVYKWGTPSQISTCWWIGSST